MMEKNIISMMSSLESISAEGAVVVLKLDGGRSENRYTIVVSGGRLKEEFFRKDGSDLLLLCEEALECYEAHSH